MSDDTSMQVSDGANGDRVVRVNTPSNSNRSRDARAQRPAAEKRPEKKVEKVVTGEVTQRKKGLGRKIADTFTGENMKSVGQYILQEIVVPQIKTLISDAVSQGVDRTMWGDSRRSSSSTRTYGSGMRTNYNSQYNNYGGNRYNNSPAGRAGQPDGPQQRTRGSRDLGDIVLENRGEADYVLESMSNLIDQYQSVTVSDFYDLVGITGEFTDEKFGWYDIRDARIRRVSRGWLLELPRPVSIDG